MKIQLQPVKCLSQEAKFSIMISYECVHSQVVPGMTLSEGTAWKGSWSMCNMNRTVSKFGNPQIQKNMNCNLFFFGRGFQHLPTVCRFALVICLCYAKYIVQLSAVAGAGPNLAWPSLSISNMDILGAARHVKPMVKSLAYKPQTTPTEDTEDSVISPWMSLDVPGVQCLDPQALFVVQQRSP